MKHIISFLFSIFLFTGLSFGQDLNDPQIASAAVKANQVDIEYAEIAIERSNNEAVVDFAETMIRDHKAVIGQAVKLVTELGVTPDDNNPITSLLNDMAAKRKANLQNVCACAFDQIYIDNEVSYHETVIGVVKDVLIPQTDNQQLSTLLKAVLPSLEAHLEHAKMVQEKVYSGTSTTTSSKTRSY